MVIIILNQILRKRMLKKMKKNSKKIYIYIILGLLWVALIYISDISNLPEQIVLFEGEQLNLKTIAGVKIDTSFSSNPNIERIENNKTAEVSAVAENGDYTGRLNLQVSLLGFKVKDINVEIIENTEVIPLRKLNWSKIIH